MRNFSVSIFLCLISQSSFGGTTCDVLFKPATARLSFRDHARKFRLARRDAKAQTAFLKHIAKVKRKGDSENVLVGETQAGKFKPRGWADLRKLDVAAGHADVSLDGELLTVSLADVFIFEDFGYFKSGESFVRTRLRSGFESDSSDVFFVHGFGPNGLMLLERIGARANSSKNGFDVLPIEDLVIDKTRR